MVSMVSAAKRVLKGFQRLVPFLQHLWLAGPDRTRDPLLGLRLCHLEAVGIIVPREATRARLTWSFLAVSRSSIHSLTNKCTRHRGSVRGGQAGGRAALGLVGGRVRTRRRSHRRAATPWWRLSQQPTRPYPLGKT